MKKMKDLNELTDEELALIYIDGNRRAFDILLKRTEVKLFSYIMFVVHDEELANDIFQETFVKVLTWLHEKKYVVQGKFSAWCMRIAHNVIMDLYRERSSHKVVTTENNDFSHINSNELLSGCTEVDMANQQILADVKKVMNLLPPTQREVVYMRFYQDLSFKEIAELTNVSINTSLGRMRYALLNMRRMVREHNVMLDWS